MNRRNWQQHKLDRFQLIAWISNSSRMQKSTLPTAEKGMAWDVRLLGDMPAQGMGTTGIPKPPRHGRARNGLLA